MSASGKVKSIKWSKVAVMETAMRRCRALKGAVKPRGAPKKVGQVRIFQSKKNGTKKPSWQRKDRSRLKRNVGAVPSPKDARRELIHKYRKAFRNRGDGEGSGVNASRRIINSSGALGE